MAKLLQPISLMTQLGLIILLIIAGVALYKIRTLSLPISNVIGIATVFLPIANAAGLQSIRSLLIGSNGSTRKFTSLTWSVAPMLLILVIYETAIATLSLTHMAPLDNLNCGLDRKWERLFRNKDALAIRRIQNAHQCCGLHSIRDKAWPFADQNHDVDSCAKTFNRTKSCLGSWRRDEQVAAGLILTVAIASFFLKLFILFIARTQSSWLSRAILERYPALRGVDAGNGEVGSSDEYLNCERRRIEGPYRDDPALRNNLNEEVGPETETITDRNHQASIRQEIQGPIMQPSRLIDGDNAWRDNAE